MKFEYLKKVVVCPDSFKGSIDAVEATEVISNQLKKLRPEADILRMPLSDGGEGISAILLNKGGWEKHTIEVHDALMRPMSAYFLWKPRDKEAFIESASIIGLPFLKDSEKDPLITTSFGLGEAILKAIELGGNKISVALGGSATCDGGMGMLKALGFKFMDIAGDELKTCGKSMQDIAKIIIPANSEALKRIEFKAMCDVENPLYGKDGAAFVYAPQKGATPSGVVILDRGLRNFSEKVESVFDIKGMTTVGGAGAAGGLGFAMMSTLGAGYVRGIDFMLREYGFRGEIKDADLIITGEGRADRQSLMGKVLSGVLAEANRFHIPVISLTGKIDDYDLLIYSGLNGVYEISDPELSLAENMKPSITVSNLQNALSRILK